MRHLQMALACLTVAVTTLIAADWTGFRGPRRDGISSEKGLLRSWPKDGPKLLWKSESAGQGYAGMAVVGGIVYTMGARGEDEYAIALDNTGKELWATKIGPVHDWEANSWSRGPNATPTVAGDRVFALSSKGDLLCANKADGKELWRVSISRDLNGEVNAVGGGIERFGWGYSWSPLVDGEQLVIVPGGKDGLFAALDVKTGKTLWRSTAVTDAATYSSPVVGTLAGVKQYVYLTQQSLVGVSAKDGQLLWIHKRDEPYPDVVCPTPIIQGDQVYISVGKGGGSELLKITKEGDKFKATSVYSEKAIGNAQGGVILLDGTLYGYHENRNWAAQDFATGKLLWPTKRTRQGLKAGAILAADGLLFAVVETGPEDPGIVGLMEASAKEYRELSQFTLPAASKKRKSQGAVWAYPSLSDGKLYVRDQEMIFCYQVK
jgi:outer membrane protein assembly factor BamB